MLSVPQEQGKIHFLMLRVKLFCNSNFALFTSRVNILLIRNMQLASLAEREAGSS